MLQIRFNQHKKQLEFQAYQLVISRWLMRKLQAGVSCELDSYIHHITVPNMHDSKDRFLPS